MMDMIHDLNSDLQNHMADTIYDGKPLVWEMFCQKDSELSNAMHVFEKAYQCNE